TANLDIAKASQQIAVAQYEKTIQTAFKEVADALAGRATYADQLSAMDRLVSASQKAYELSDLRYRNGVASYMDLLDAQRVLFDAQQQQILARLSMLNNQVTLYKVLAGGWDNGENAQKMAENTQAGDSASGTNQAQQ
ncbi:MAG: TolC family protein, partial [Saezia sp.]